MIRFHLDENMPNAVASGLRSRGRDVTTSHEVEMRGASDLAQLEFAKLEGRVIVTRDDDLLSLASSGFAHSGIVYWTEKKRFGQLVKDLDALCYELSAEEMIGTIKFC